MHDPAPAVFVVDDDPAVRKALERLLRSAGLQAVLYASPAEFLERHDPAASGCLLLDYSMPGLDGLQLQQALAGRNIALPIVFLSGQGDIPITVEAMKHGAVDFLTKPVNDKNLLEAVARAIERDRTGRLARAELDGIEQRIDTLTPREREVLGHLVAGKPNKVIAAEIGTVEKTVKVHRARVLEKMQAASLADLVRLAGRAGIAPTPSP